MCFKSQIGRIAAILLSVFAIGSVSAKGQQLDYSLNIVPAKNKKVFSMQPTEKNTFLLCGSDLSTITKDNPYGNLWVATVSSAGTIAWEKTLPVKSYRTIGGLIKVDAKTFATIAKDGGRSILIEITADGENIKTLPIEGNAMDAFTARTLAVVENGYIIAGLTKSSDGQRSKNLSVLKIARTGAVLWEKQYAHLNVSDCKSITATTDGEFLITGITGESNGDIATNTGRDVFVANLSGAGNIVWQYAYGGEGDQYAGSAIQTIDGGFMICGSTNVFRKDAANTTGADGYLLKLNRQGGVEWQKTFGGAYQDNFYSIVQLGEEYLLSGITCSGNNGLKNANGWLLSVSQYGVENWQKRWENSIANQLSRIDDEHYAFTGIKWADGVYYPFIAASNIKESKLGISQQEEIDQLLVYPSITKDRVTIQLPKSYRSAKVNVLSAPGQTVQAQISEDGLLRTVNLSGLSAGTYLIQITTGALQEVHKVILQP